MNFFLGFFCFCVWNPFGVFVFEISSLCFPYWPQTPVHRQPALPPPMAASLTAVSSLIILILASRGQKHNTIGCTKTRYIHGWKSSGSSVSCLCSGFSLGGALYWPPHIFLCKDSHAPMPVIKSSFSSCCSLSLCSCGSCNSHPPQWLMITK